MLTEDQIQSLFTFLEKKKIKDYDLKMELADHLSEAIEEEMKTQPDFNIALQNVYKSFGVFGFNKVVEEKTNVIEKFFKSEYNYYFNRYFTLPKIIGTLLLFFVLLFLGNNLGKDHGELYILGLATLSLFVGISTNLILRKKFLRPLKTLVCLPRKNFIPDSLLFWLPFIIFRLVFRNYPLLADFFVDFLCAYYSVITLTILAKAQAYQALYHKARKEYPLAFS